MLSFVFSLVVLAGVYTYAVIGLAGAFNAIRRSDRDYNYIPTLLRRLVGYRVVRILALLVAPLVFVTYLVVFLLVFAIIELPDAAREATDTLRQVVSK